MNETFLKKNRIMIGLAILAGMVLGVVNACTSPDAVYASIQNSPERRETISYLGTVYAERKLVVYPEEILVQEGNQYRLVSAELKEVPMEGILTYMSVVIPYELEGTLEPPETTKVTLLDERTNETYQRDVECLDMEEKRMVWDDTFEFSITISDVDAEYFWLGDLEIPADSDLSLYGTQFLEMLGLSEECYRVHSVEWVGERYEKDGVYCRDAIGKGEKRIRFVDVTYGGQVRTPETIGYRYESVYEKIENLSGEETYEAERPIEEKDEEHLHLYNQKTLFEQIKQFVQEHLTIVTVSVLFLGAIFVCLGILVSSRKKEPSDET